MRSLLTRCLALSALLASSPPEGVSAVRISSQQEAQGLPWLDDVINAVNSKAEELKQHGYQEFQKHMRKINGQAERDLEKVVTRYEQQIDQEKQQAEKEVQQFAKSEVDRLFEEKEKERKAQEKS